MEELNIRPATAEDHDAVAACVNAAYAKYVPRMGMEPAPMLADYDAEIARGVVWVLPGPDGVRAVLVMWPEGDGLFLENIAVQPQDQGRGLGRRLMAFAEEQARAQRLRELRLYTNEVMTENIAFYGRLGYEEVDRRLDEGYHRVFMRKPLA